MLVVNFIVKLLMKVACIAFVGPGTPQLNSTAKSLSKTASCDRLTDGSSIGEACGGFTTPERVPSVDWDKQSSDNLSEISLQCLQVRNIKVAFLGYE